MLFWRDRPTFITGATGLLGGHLVRRLLDADARVICLIRDEVPDCLLADETLRGRCVLVRGEVTDPAAIERIMAEYEIDTVFHLAAQTIVSIASRHPCGTFDSNIRGTWTVLEAARRCAAVKQIMVASSDKVYGPSDSLPCDEDAPLRGSHPYEVSKACADMIAQCYARTYDLPVVITRCGNLFGGGDLNFNRLVPGTIRSVLRGERPVVRSDGRFVRDYLYADDAAAAYMQLAQRLSQQRGLAGHAFNFCDEQPATVLEIVRAVLQRMDCADEPIILDEVREEITHQRLCSAKSRAMLGWRPQWCRNDALDATIRWYRAYFSEITGEPCLVRAPERINL